MALPRLASHQWNSRQLQTIAHNGFGLLGSGRPVLVLVGNTLYNHHQRHRFFPCSPRCMRAAYQHSVLSLFCSCFYGAIQDSLFELCVSPGQRSRFHKPSLYQTAQDLEMDWFGGRAQGVIVNAPVAGGGIYSILSTSGCLLLLLLIPLAALFARVRISRRPCLKPQHSQGQRSESAACLLRRRSSRTTRFVRTRPS